MAAINLATSYKAIISEIELNIQRLNFHSVEITCLSSMQHFPADFTLHYFLTLAAHHQDKKETITHALKTFEILNSSIVNVKNTQHINTLGCIFKMRGYYSMAIKCFEITLFKEPKNYEAICNIGLTYADEDNYSAALKYLFQAENLKSSHEILTNIGNIYLKQNQFDDSLHYLEMALALDLENSASYYRIGALLQNKGLKKEAEKYFRISLEKNPDYLPSYFALAEVINFSKNNNDHIQIIEKIKSLLSLSNLTNEYFYKLHFALGKIYQDTQDYDNSFQHFKIANDHKSIQHPFNVGHRENFHIRYSNNYTKEFGNKRRSYGNKTNIPIFIVGMPRSGTTLTEQIISSHSKIIGKGEAPYLNEIISSIVPKKIPGSLSPITAYPEIMNYLPREDISNFASTYLKKATQGLDTKFKIANKMPENFLHIGFINLIFPNATLIHCKRHPLDICLSIYFHNFADVQFSTQMEWIIKSYKCYHNLMGHWHKEFPGKIYDSYYEELVYRTEEKSRALINICGLKWEENCLNFYKNDSAVFTASRLQVKQPMYKNSIFQFKNYENYLGLAKEILKDEIAEYEQEIIQKVPELFEKL